MDEKELIRDLEQAEPPRIDLKSARARLRRELLASPEFEARVPLARRIPRWRLVFAGLATAAVVVILAIQLVPRRSSAEALIAAMGSAYDASIVPDAIHYSRQSLRLNGDRPIEIESWSYASQGKFRVRVKDAERSKTLGHTISDAGRIYNLPESSVHVVGDMRRWSQGREGEAESGGPDRLHGHRMMTIVVTRVHENEDWSDKTRARAFLISDFFNRFPLVGRTPHDLVRELEGSDQVMYAGATLDSRSQLEVELLERRNAGAFPFVVEFPMKHLDNVKWFFNRVIANASQNATVEAYTALLKERGLEHVISLRRVEPIERVEVDAKTSRIRKLSLSILQHGEETYSAETTFLEDRFLPYTPDTFDPDLHDLSPDSRSTLHKQQH